MISYKTYKLINESFASPMALGLAPVHSVGVAGSKLSEMGLRPDEIDDLEGEEGMEGEEGLEPGPEVGVDGGMGDEMGDEMMGDEEGIEDAPFPPEEMEDMESLAGLGGEDELGDEMDELGGEDEMMDDDDLEDEEFPMEGKKHMGPSSCGKKHMCPETSDDEEHQEEDDKKKYMKKNMGSSCGKKMMKKGYNEAKASFWEDFLKNAAGTHKFEEDAVIAPQNPNQGLGDADGATPGEVGSAPQQRLGIGDGNGRVETDFFGYQAVQ